MLVYSNYSTDARVRREAETIVALPEHKVVVLTLREGSSPRQYTLENVKVRELDVPKYRGKNGLKYILSYLRFMWLAFCAINGLLFRNAVDVVHVHNMPNFLLMAAVIPLMFGKPLILDVHDTLIETFFSKFSHSPAKLIHKILLEMLLLEERVCCRMAYRIICVNHIQREALVNRGVPEGKTIIAMNVPDPRRFRNKDVNKGFNRPEGKFRLVYFGTITKRLGIDLAIRSVAHLDHRIPGIELHIIGDGEDKEEFIHIAQELGIRDRVVFSDRFVPLDELVSRVSEMDLLVVPNRKNDATQLMLPVKMLESIIMDIPVVVPRLKGIQYYFNDDMVFFFEPDNLESLASVILEAFNNRSLRLQKAEKAHDFLKKYGWETHKWELINLYRSL